MANMTNEHEALVRRVLEGDGRAPHAQRRAAFDNSGLTGPIRTLTEKVAKHADKVTDEDITAARSSGLTKDQIFELAVCAAVGQATRQYETALAALDAATGGSPHASRRPR
jgi:alkylhydroperoxidase family enzyme